MRFCGIELRDRQVSWTLLIALLPTLLFFGHWPDIQFSLPGTGLTLAVPFISHDHSGAPDEDGHTQHCHANVGTCTDVPFTGASAFAYLSESVAALGIAAAFIGLVALCWRPLADQSVAPELQPPRLTCSSSPLPN
jgi:hypothetical protein